MKDTLARLSQSRLLFALAFAAVLGLFIVQGVRYSITASDGPDEVAHFLAIRFVAEHGRLPETVEERLTAGYKADLPPLYYLTVGGLGRVLGLATEPRLKTNRDDLRLALVTGHDNIKAWRRIITEDRWRGEVLLWYMGRWLSLLFGAVGLLLLFALVKVSIPERRWLALGGMALLAFLPNYIYISSVTSYEALTGVLMSAYLLALAFIIKDPRRLLLYFVAGALIGLAAATRHTPWPALPLVPMLVIWLAASKAQSWPVTLAQLALYSLGVLLTLGWWVAYIVVYFNRIEQLGLLPGVAFPVLIGDGGDAIPQQIAGTVTGGQLGLGNLPQEQDSVLRWAGNFFFGMWGQGWTGWLMLAAWGVAVAGLVRWLHAGSAQTRQWLVLLAAYVGAILFFPWLRFYFSGSAGTGMTQHLLFPAGAAIILLLIYGLTAFPKLSTYAPLFLLAMSAVYAGQVLSRALETPLVYPVVTQAPADDPNPVAQFETVSLLRANAQPDAAGQALGLTLWWRADSLPPDDYQTELTLLTEAGQPAAVWLGQPLNGRYPTRAWLPGEQVRQEVSLPVAGLPLQTYRLQLRLLAAGHGAGEPVPLGDIRLAPQPLATTRQLSLAGQTVGYRLWPGQLDGQRDGLPLFGENATVTLATDPPLDPAESKVALVGPAGQVYPAATQVGGVVLFQVSPQMAAGSYRLRVAQAGATAETPPLLQIETEPRLFAPEVPIAHPLEADFAGYVALLGYNLTTAQVQPGQAVPLELFWQARRVIGADLVFFNHLIGPDGQQWAGRDRRAREVYSTLFWAPNEVVSDVYQLDIPPQTPPGDYYLLVGLYLPVGKSAVSLPLLSEGQLSEVTHVSIGPIKVMPSHGN